ncbi:MAG TPA: endonuclease/exonuclease/phosphatase family protein [Methanocorpusculum sp.]|nr:endonuclease/exonuclease/phosphatase family protein [Methanocorpusculum sp.]
MKKTLFTILFLFPLTLQASDPDSLIVVFWNVENFFDYIDQGTGESDTEWSSQGSRRWTRKKFQTKCDDMAKSLFWIGEKYGSMPDVIGLAEVENRNVLWRLLNDTMLRKCGYKIVHYDSMDRRGIDVALLYRDSAFDLINYSVTTPDLEATRDILQVCLRDRTGQRINLIVNHHPSKYGGSEVSEGRRIAAMNALKKLCDSLSVVDPGVPVIAMGDFNDTPDAVQFKILDGVLSNRADSLYKAGRGTIRYQGKWDLIDMFMVSADLACKSFMDILEVPFLMTYENKYPGVKPLRTYSGPRYIGGVSDHCPIVLCLFRSN